MFVLQKFNKMKKLSLYYDASDLRILSV